MYIYVCVKKLGKVVHRFQSTGDPGLEKHGNESNSRAL